MKIHTGYDENGIKCTIFSDESRMVVTYSYMVCAETALTSQRILDFDDFFWDELNLSVFTSLVFIGEVHETRRTPPLH